jgi:hypothetical protein
MTDRRQEAHDAALLASVARQCLPPVVRWGGLVWTLEETGGGCTCYQAPQVDDEGKPTGRVWLATVREAPSAPRDGDWAEVRLHDDSWNEVEPMVSLFVRWRGDDAPLVAIGKVPNA